MAQETSLNITKFGSTYSALKQEALKSAIEANAIDVEEVFSVLRLGGQGAGLGTGTISGDDNTLIIIGVGTLFTSELTVSDTIFVNGEALPINGITNDLELNVSVTPPSATFNDLQFSYKV